MASSNSFMITHFQNGEKHDFNLIPVPTAVIPQLIRALQWDFQKRNSADAAPFFREERAKFIDKVEQANREKGLNIDSTQLFIDFKKP